jgi:rhamnogalacturonyl hydrolase YesR
MLKIKVLCIISFLFLTQLVVAQTDATTPLHLLKPDYPIPYGIPKQEDVVSVLNRVHGYLDAVTPPAFVNEKTGEVFTDATKIDANTILQRGDFRIVSYEWGVTYAGMLLASESTGDPKYRDYVEKRLAFIADAAASFRKPAAHYEEWEGRMPLRNLLNPRTLDDTGAMSAAMIKAKRAGSKADLQPVFERGLNHIMTGQYRLADETLARNRPQPNTLWLDDLFMSVPAIAQMGKLTGDNKYYDEAANQVLSFAAKMFNRERGVFMHGWVESMPTHPVFRWARANGWAFMALAVLLEVLPVNHPQRP